MELLIPNFPKYSDGQLLKAVERELRTGVQLKKETERQREIEAEHQAKMMRASKTLPGVGKHVATMPAWEFFRLKQKYGYDEIHSKEFLRYYQKKFPALATASI